jgi:hypothetical protein
MLRVAGTVAEGFVWGRGALDVKIGVLGLLEAATLLLKEGWAPKRTILFAFGQVCCPACQAAVLSHPVAFVLGDGERGMLLVCANAG